MDDSSKRFIITLTIFLLTMALMLGLAWAQEEVTELVKARLSSSGKILDLSGLKGHFKLGPDGAKKLAKMKDISNVTTLMLQGNKIRYQGLKALMKSSYLINLKHIDLRRTRSPLIILILGVRIH